MLRERFSEELKNAMKARDQRQIATLRLILAALKDRDIAARTESKPVGEAEIIEMLQKMVRQRQESIALYRQGNRPELVEQEEGEIAIIERFMPAKMSEEETKAAIDAAIKETGATAIKDMGRVMAILKERYSGRMDFGSIGPEVKRLLS